MKVAVSRPPSGVSIFMDQQFHDALALRYGVGTRFDPLAAWLPAKRDDTFHTLRVRIFDPSAGARLHGARLCTNDSPSWPWRLLLNATAGVKCHGMIMLPPDSWRLEEKSFDLLLPLELPLPVTRTRRKKSPPPKEAKIGDQLNLGLPGTCDVLVELNGKMRQFRVPQGEAFELALRWAGEQREVR